MVLCPLQTVQHSPGPGIGDGNNLKEKITIHTKLPNINHYIAGVGPLKNIKREAPIIPPIMYRRM